MNDRSESELSKVGHWPKRIDTRNKKNASSIVQKSGVFQVVVGSVSHDFRKVLHIPCGAGFPSTLSDSNRLWKLDFYSHKTENTKTFALSISRLRRTSDFVGSFFCLRSKLGLHSRLVEWVGMGPWGGS